ncbi:hypothetical protein CR203_11380 [Salipaludibacillus neizhouensis]|uniref:HTH luxR-type domain-containing protein n=1 Tax=Salipaludibacillus neizhouensis TaxID=885475 RepID=A0A3A9K8F7_9BACI|nr:LuxR C-terminal-related transcriptional regulator [Salipaludibacillus neizhouensis]RKL67110.1 hypothetical protein CR203_11380 [Salipaludibacillus neizhouensis]
MNLTKKREVQSLKSRIIYYDQSSEILSGSLRGKISEEIIALTLKQQKDTKEDWIFFSFDNDDKYSLNLLLEKIHELKRKEDCHILLISKNPLHKQLLTTLSFPVSGLVSLPYLKDNYSKVLQTLLNTGIFLEADFHKDIVNEIDHIKYKSMPIKQLVLIKDKVDLQLSKNEQIVLQLILDGKNNKNIAEKLYFAESTISTIVCRLIKKTCARDRTDALVKAIKCGWVEGQR